VHGCEANVKGVSMKKALSKLPGEMWLVIGAIAFAFNGLPAKLMLNAGPTGKHLSSMRLTEVRTGGAFVILLVIQFFSNRKALRVGKKDLAGLTAFGLIGIAAVQCFYFAAISRLHISIALVIEFTAPIWIALWLRFVKREKVSSLMWWGLAIAFTGLLFLAQVWSGFHLDHIGFVSALIDAFALATYFVIGKSETKKRPIRVTLVWGMGIASFFFAIALPWWSFPFRVFSEKVVMPSAFHIATLPGWVLFAWIAFLGTVLPYLCVTQGLSKLSASTTSAIGMLEPVFAGIFGWWLLAEQYTLSQVLGGIAILFGIYLSDKAHQ
jgi:drug/metabolite transporter (DMT)-like permease